MDDTLHQLALLLEPLQPSPEVRQILREEAAAIRRGEEALSLREFDALWAAADRLAAREGPERFGQGFRLGVQPALAGLGPVNWPGQKSK